MKDTLNYQFVHLREVLSSDCLHKLFILINTDIGRDVFLIYIFVNQKAF